MKALKLKVFFPDGEHTYEVGELDTDSFNPIFSTIKSIIVIGGREEGLKMAIPIIGYEDGTYAEIYNSPFIVVYKK